MRQRIHLILGCALATICLTGCGSMMGSLDGSSKLDPRSLEPPMITAVNVTPTTVGFDGVPVTIQADVTDADGVDVVWAAIGPEAAQVPSVLLGKVAGQTYRGGCGTCRQTRRETRRQRTTP
ncbi:MAG TPA: hypothetical protein VHR86_07770 [Armatimonadota bacterium]|nr:hypothetical protein [Armatimonadota bacterium]